MNRDELLEAVYTAYEDRYEKPMYPPYAELAVDTILEEINEGVTEEWCRGKGAWVTARMTSGPVMNICAVSATITMKSVTAGE